MDFLNTILSRFETGFEASDRNLDTFLNTLPIDPLTGLPNVLSLMNDSPREDPHHPKGYDRDRWKFEDIPEPKEFLISSIIAPNVFEQLPKLLLFQSVIVSLSAELITYLSE